MPRRLRAAATDMQVGFYSTAQPLEARHRDAESTHRAIGHRYNHRMPDVARMELLGGLSTAAFLRKYWQKRPLLVRRAVRGFSGLLTRAQLFALAERDDVESRLISYVDRQRTLVQGPFRAAELKALPPRQW